MIVLGADMHKRSHTITAVAAATGEMLGEKTSSVGARGFDQVLQWARALGVERVWALEDCRHVSGSFERFLIARGERVIRVPNDNRSWYFARISTQRAVVTWGRCSG
jgi:transposase